MGAGKYDFTIEQGATHVTTFVWKTQPGSCCDDDVPEVEPEPVDITDYTLAMQVRPSPSSETLYFEATSVNGMLPIVTPELGQFALYVSAEESAGWTWKRGVYDILMVSPLGFVTRLLQGSVTVSPDVTVITELET